MVKIKFRKFTQEEIDNIVCDYKKGMRPKDLEIKYNRNSGTIIGKLKSLGVFKPTKYRFAKDDHDWLKKNYSHANIDVVKEHFSNIPLQSIRSYCSSHHIMMSDFNWTKNDENIIHKYHSEKTLDELYKMLDGRFSKKSIALKRYNLGYSHSRKWADEEIMFLKNNYSFKSMDYILNGLPNRTYDGIVKKAMELNLPSMFYLETYWNKHDKDFLSSHWKDYSDYELSKKIGKSVNSISAKRCSLGLSRCNRGCSASYESLSKFIRGNISDWKAESMKLCNYHCAITGDSSFQIHHLYSFSRILEDIVTENTAIKIYDNLSDYTNDELSFILYAFKKHQAEYPLGVCVRKDLHTLFHNLYGKYDINEHQFWQFKNDYLNGVYTQTN